MKSPMAKSFLVCSFLVFGFSLCSSSASALSTLDIGTEYRLRAMAIDNPDYGQSAPNEALYSQRALAHVGGRFSPNLEFMTQIQAINVVGSTQTINNPSIEPAGSRYPSENFSPWIQTAYMKARNIFDSPVDVTVGRQPMMLGDGLILSDDDLGFTGIRVQSRFPDYGIQADAFTFRTGQSLSAGNASTDIYGLELTKPMHAIRFQLSVVNEHDASGTTIFIRPSENANCYANPNISPQYCHYDANTDWTASRITKTFYDGRVEGRLLEGGFYKAELAFQNGQVNRSSATLGSVALGGYAFALSAGLYTHISKYGPIEVHGVFAIGSGDSGGSTDDAFQPDFGHRYDGLERSGFGEYFGATPYDAFGSTNNPRGLPPGFSGIRIIGGGVTAHPTSLLSVGIDYFVYDAQELPSSQFSVSSSDTSLGSEFDIGAGFAYTSYLNFRASAAFFSPGPAFGGYSSNARRFLIEAIGHF
jgi:hypothetical protein